MYITCVYIYIYIYIRSMRAHAACSGGGPLSEMFKVILTNNNDQAYCYLSKVLFSSRISSYHFCFIVCFTRRSATPNPPRRKPAYARAAA